MNLEKLLRTMGLEQTSKTAEERREAEMTAQWKEIRKTAQKAGIALPVEKFSLPESEDADVVLRSLRVTLNLLIFLRKEGVISDTEVQSHASGIGIADSAHIRTLILQDLKDKPDGQAAYERFIKAGGNP